MPIDNLGNTLEIPQTSSGESDSANVGILPVVYPGDNDSADTDTDSTADLAYEELPNVTFDQQVSDPRLSREMRDHLKDMTKRYNKEKKHKDVIVTSAFRSHRKQAEVMYDNFRRHVSERYEDKDQFYKIKDEYDKRRARGDNPQAIINAIEQIIDYFAARGRYISYHMLGKAVDIQTTGLSWDDYIALLHAADHAGFRVPRYLYLRKPDHLHLELRH